jgi:triacylglycerol esterase/lipase EstA (alpha/beta hydrolase family)
LSFSQEIILLPRPQKYQTVSDTSYQGKSKTLKSTQNKNATTVSKLPYPILFIHGLNSNSDTWNTFTDFLDIQYGFTYGGRFDFCLNYNSNNSTSNLNFAPTTNADIAQFTNNTIVGDYYYVNFDVGSNGIVAPASSASYNVLSNQSAIYKQGKALSKAIEQILALTGKEKVVLVGHSMGGLAAREHIQNSNNWISNDPKVAKLITVGTPHGGSNSSLSVLTGIFTGINERSEAIRDIRTSYFYSGNPGTYLFGGQENNNYMFDMLFANFYNTDVNCNGVTNETIIGVNQKTLPTSLDYACIIGTFTGNGDGVVSTASANINTFYPNRTQNITTSSVIHTSLQTLPLENMMAIDEPNQQSWAYLLELNKNYLGFSNLQMQSSNNIDQDYFYFTINQTSTVTFNINNINIPVMIAGIGNENGTAIGTAHDNNNSNAISFTHTLSPGKYYLLISSAFPNASSHLTPYQINISAVLSEKIINFDEIILYPNPTKDNVYLDNSSTKFTKYEIYDYAAKLVASQELKEFSEQESINIEKLPVGIYKIILSNENHYKVASIVKD